MKQSYCNYCRTVTQDSTIVKSDNGVIWCPVCLGFKDGKIHRIPIDKKSNG